MKKLTDEQIRETYALIEGYFDRYLKAKGMKMPSLMCKNEYTKDTLVLVYLAQGYPNTRVVSKEELTQFIQLYDSRVNDVQQARHLAAQKGWFILSGTRNDIASEDIPKGSYKLQTLEQEYPSYRAARRNYSSGDEYWDELKKEYDYRCACCGSKENKPHRYWKNTITVLQKGHMDPTRPLEPGNIIPQCEKCNRADRDNWIYDEKGRVVGIANARTLEKSSREVKKEMYTRLYKKFGGKNPEDLE